jgi:hypothetical protein
MKSIILPQLMNFSNYMQNNKLMVFSEWILLNQATTEELGIGMRELCQHKTNPIYKQLLGSFKEGFMTMTAQDEETLAKHKKAF